MATTLAGFPFWLLTFDKDGRPSEPAAVDAFVRETGEKKLADLFVFSHGWNNDPAMAMSLYSAFFAEVRKLVDDATIPKRRAASIGTAGVIWPSIKWPDTEADEGGAASLDGGTPDLFEELKTVFVSADERAALKTLESLLDQQKSSDQALEQFQVALKKLMAAGGANQLDDMESAALAGKAGWKERADGAGGIRRGRRGRGRAGRHLRQALERSEERPARGHLLEDEEPRRGRRPRRARSPAWPPAHRIA